MCARRRGTSFQQQERRVPLSSQRHCCLRPDGLMPITKQHIGARWGRGGGVGWCRGTESGDRRGDGDEREGGSAADVHLSCIIAANASAAILAEETM